MLRELENVSQPEGEPERRWFSSAQMDLITWHKDYDMVGFQLCYDKDKDEHALTWMRDAGWTHRRIENGEQRGAHHKMTPILLPDGIVDEKRIRMEFEKASESIDPEIRSKVLNVINEICGR